MRANEWLETLAGGESAGSLTSRVRAEFNRLGFYGRNWQDERLRLAALLAGSRPLDRLRDLTAGESARVIVRLSRFTRARDLYVSVDPGGELAGIFAWLSDDSDGRGNR